MDYESGAAKGEGTIGALRPARQAELLLGSGSAGSPLAPRAPSTGGSFSFFLPRRRLLPLLLFGFGRVDVDSLARFRWQSCVRRVKVGINGRRTPETMWRRVVGDTGRRLFLCRQVVQGGGKPFRSWVPKEEKLS
jgi:hypothetical protein